MTPELYLSLMTMHGTIMVFFVLTTAPQGGFGNYFLPIQIGARGHGVPASSTCCRSGSTFLAFVVLIAAFFVAGGAPLSRLDRVPAAQRPRHSRRARAGRWAEPVDHPHRAFSASRSLLGALNFITTTLDLRAKGMTLMRMPLTCWAWFITAILGLLAFARAAGRRHPAAARPHRRHQLLHPRRPGGQRPAAATTQGGSPLLWQHLFWFFGHPEVYIAILPGMGVDLAHPLRPSPASRSSATRRWSTPWSRSASWASWSGATTCSSAA